VSALLGHAGHAHDGGGPGYEWISYAAIAFGVVYAMVLVFSKRRR
jgi:hypothetical protein